MCGPEGAVCPVAALVSCPHCGTLKKKSCGVRACKEAAAKEAAESEGAGGAEEEEGAGGGGGAVPEVPPAFADHGGV